MADKDTDDTPAGSFLANKITILLFALIAVLVVASAIYGYETQDERIPDYTMDDVPGIADGTYSYDMTIELDIIQPVLGVDITFVDGDVTSIIVDGETLEKEKLINLVSLISDSLDSATVRIGSEWTDGSSTVGTHLAECSFGNVLFSDDGKILNLDYISSGYSLSLTLDGWMPVES